MDIYREREKEREREAERKRERERGGGDALAFTRYCHEQALVSG